MSDWRKRAKPVDVSASGSDWKSRARPVADVGSPLDLALEQQAGPVVTVETPTGPAQFTRDGRRVYSSEEAQQMAASGLARGKSDALSGALSFLSGGGPLLDEGAGAVEAAKSVFTTEPASDAYFRVRNQARSDVRRATDEVSPQVEIAGAKLPVLPIAGAMLPSLATPMAPTWLGRVATSGAIGAEQAAGESQAELLRGEGDKFARDVATGGGVGVGGGLVAEGVAVPMRMIARGAASRIGDSVATRAAKDIADVGDEVASLRGKLGGESQKASRLFENTQRAVSGGVAPAGQSAIDPALQGKAMLALSDPSTVRLQEKVLERSLGELPTQTAVVEGLERELAQRSAGAGAEAAKRTQAYFAEPVSREMGDRLGRLTFNTGTGAASGALTGTAMGLGALLSGMGDPLTAGAVGLASGITNGFQKSAITMGRNTLASPRVQVGALEALIKGAQGGQKVLQSQARATAAVTPRELSEQEEEAVQAFLSGG